MKSVITGVLCGLAALAAALSVEANEAPLRNIVYFDQYV